ncbi:twin-arginine translocase subunit TatC [Halegenticoccus tardaugens]|uniref:twin-arginine translocase subunit TatC n=1 Tax=Halegenticoccus tardaugens TaxID=2071624 RepID=UPI00100C0D26|nr:twin-arginine translocase subunit TatC [Halegenticoccus tardaugens]
MGDESESGARSGVTELSDAEEDESAESVDAGERDGSASEGDSDASDSADSTGDSADSTGDSADSPDDSADASPSDADESGGEVDAGTETGGERADDPGAESAHGDDAGASDLPPPEEFDSEEEYLEAEREYLDRREEELIAADPLLDDGPPDERDETDEVDGDAADATVVDEAGARADVDADELDGSGELEGSDLDGAEMADVKGTTADADAGSEEADAALDSQLEPVEPPVAESEDGFDAEDEPEIEADAAAVDADEDEGDEDDEFLDRGIVGDGPEYDEEMPLADHIEEMVKRLGVVFVIGAIVTLVAFPTADRLINYMWNTHIPGAVTNAALRPRLYSPLEFILTKLKVAGLAGLVIGLPAFVYETYLFMRPGLYPKERRYYLAAVPTSLILALVGIAFAHFIVLPAIFSYFTVYTERAADIAFGLAETFNLILLLMGYMAIVFQIPLFVMLAIMMNLVTRRWLEDKRLIFWGSFFGLSFLVSPDPTGMAPIIVAATMIVLFEGTLALLRWTGN